MRIDKWNECYSAKMISIRGCLVQSKLLSGRKTLAWEISFLSNSSENMILKVEYLILLFSSKFSAELLKCGLNYSQIDWLFINIWAGYCLSFPTCFILFSLFCFVYVPFREEFVRALKIHLNVYCMCPFWPIN